MSCFFGKSSKTKGSQQNKYKSSFNQETISNSDKKITLHHSNTFNIQKFYFTPYQLYIKSIKDSKYASHQSIFNKLNIKNSQNNQSLENIDFPVLGCSINKLLTNAKKIIVEENSRRCQANKFNLDLLLIKIAESYKNNSYHNFAHAFSTLLLLYQSYKLSKHLQSLFTSREWLFIFIAALSHDISHPGTNNDYQNKLKTKCSIQSNKQSVLEKFHISYLWALLQNNSQINFLLVFDPNTINQIKKLITRLILSTDMAKHTEKMNNLKNIAKKQGKMSRQQSFNVVQGLFHACDVGNPCLSYQNYNNWAILIASQFNSIAQSEASMGFQVNKLLKYEGLNKFYKNQKGFCDFIVLPLWKQLNCIFSQFCVFTHNIECNIKQLQQQIIKSQEKEL